MYLSSTPTPFNLNRTVRNTCVDRLFPAKMAAVKKGYYANTFLKSLPVCVGKSDIL